jgi:hypothetical protein
MSDAAAVVCRTKVPYGSRHNAQLVIIRMRERRQSRDKRKHMVKAYQCSVCAQWHLGNTNGTKD